MSRMRAIFQPDGSATDFPALARFAGRELTVRDAGPIREGRYAGQRAWEPDPLPEGWPALVRWVPESELVKVGGGET